MKEIKSMIFRAVVIFIIFTIVCGLIYTLVVTAFAQVLFPEKADGSIININGKKYGSERLAQQYTDDAHMWGRVMNVDVTTYRDKEGKPLMYATPSNLSSDSEEYKELVADRVKKIKSAHPHKGDEPIPVDLVTCSGSGLDPHISVSAAEYQISRLAAENNLSHQDVQKIIDRCKSGRFLGFLGEETVNVLEVNLILDGILK